MLELHNKFIVFVTEYCDYKVDYCRHCYSVTLYFHFNGLCFGLLGGAVPDGLFSCAGLAAFGGWVATVG